MKQEIDSERRNLVGAGIVFALFFVAFFGLPKLVKREEAKLKIKERRKGK